MSPLVLHCVILSLFHLAIGNVPVLLWESSKSDRITSFPATRRITKDDFQQYLLKKVHGEQPVPLIIVFTEKSLSVEDFSWQDSQGHGYFPELKYISEYAANVEFLPSVQDPITAANQLSEFGYTLQEIDSNMNDELLGGCGKVLMVKMKDPKPDEDRSDFLRRHDVKMAEIYSQSLSNCSHVIGILSGLQPSWVEAEEVSRMRRAATDNETESTSDGLSDKYSLYQDAKGFSLVYSNGKPTLISSGKEVNVNNTKFTVMGDTSKPLEIKLIVKYGAEPKLTFIFDKKTNGYWYLRTVEYEPKAGAEPIILKPSMEIYAPLKMSFHSGSKVTFFNRTMDTTLSFPDLQLQPFFAKPGSKAFDDAVDAVTFFTPAIWSGIFVTFLLAFIFTWGIIMIMDIRTMDQFDDPKGKTITVTATD